MIISGVKFRARKTMHKYRIELSTSADHARELDRKNNNTLWIHALSKEIINIGVAFEVILDGKQRPADWSKLTRHIIFDIKMDFTRKARWVLDGHKTPNPAISKYAGVVSRESIQITFTYAVLNDLDICLADIQNAYLQTLSSKKNCIICGPGFGLENVGNTA